MRAIEVKAAAQFVAWCLAILVTVLSLVPPGLRPATGAPHNLEHIAIFAATGAAFGFGYSGRPFLYHKPSSLAATHV